MIPDCTTLYCPRPGTVPGVFRTEAFRDGPEVDHHVTYCDFCARSMHADGLFFPANEDDVAPPEFTDEEKAKLAEFGMLDEFDNPPPPESFDARAVVRRVMALAERFDSYALSDEHEADTSTPGDRLYWQSTASTWRSAAAEIRAAVEGDAA